MPASLNALSQKQLWLKFVLSTALSFLVVIIALVVFEVVNFRQERQDETREINRQLAELRSDVEFTINNNLNLAKGLATFISVNPNVEQQEFSQFTKQLLSEEHQIRNIGAAKDLVISHIYPIAGNESTIGFNYLESPQQKMGVLKALELGKIVLAGPLNLVQGGIGLIARSPIYNSVSGESWGVLSVVLNHLEVLQASGITSTMPFNLAIQGRDSLGVNGEFFYGSQDILTMEPVKISVNLPYGHWIMYGTPTNGWTPAHPHLHVWAGALLFLLFWTFLLFHRYRSERLEMDSLQNMFESEKKFRKIFHNHNAMMLLIDKASGKIIDVNQSALDFYGYTHQQLTSKSIYDINVLSEDDIKTEMGKAVKREKNYFVFPHTLSSGKIRFVEVHSTPMEIDGVPSLFSILHDISERIEVEQKLKLDAKVFEHSQEGVLMTDAQLRIISVNKAFSEITGYSPDEVLGKNPSILRSGRHDNAFFTNMYTAISKNGFWKGEIWNRKKDGTIYPQLLSISKVENDARELTHFVAVFSDITKLKQSEAQMKQLAHYDALTGLPNRLLLMSRMEHAAEKIKRHKAQKIAVLFLDLDHFKIVNDSLGHAAGDELLKLVAVRLKEQLREEDTVSRLGGDEFAILLEGVKDLNALATIAQNIIESVKRPYTLQSGQDAVIGTSIGIAMFPDDTNEIDKLLTCSDAAMYKAKQNGRNTFSFYTQSITSDAEHKLKRINEIRKALEKEQFELYYQPQIDLQSLKIVGAEALIRWNHPKEGVLSPFAFIGIAEETGLIHEISKWVIATGCEQLKKWQNNHKQLTLSLNVSPKDFRYDDLHKIVGEQLQLHSIKPELLELELTENGLMETSVRIKDLLQQLKSLGISLAVDDFGTGHSSISYLKHFPVDKLKIDRSFVIDLANDASDRMITETIVDMAKNFNLTVVAEGVETDTQQDLLRELGCHIAQGYLYSKPIPIKQFEKLLKASSFSFELD
ncbi:MAG: EAL domain-containing protein [Aestuariibacter sp.]